MRRPFSNRARLRALAALVGAALAGGALAAAPSAEAAPAVAGLQVAAGARTLTAAWTATAGATGYTVQLSGKASLAHPRTIRTTRLDARFGGLKNDTDYWIRVSAAIPATTTAGAATAVSRIAHAVPTGRVPEPTASVRADPGPAKDQVRVTWTGGGPATKVAVLAGSDSWPSQRVFHSAWYPATTRSIVLTVPARYRAYLGAGTGQPVFVKVVQSNSPSTSFGNRFSLIRKYRLSPSGTWSFAKAVVPAAAVTKVKVGELNIQSVGSTDSSAFSAVNRWSSRASRAAAYVNTASPDLLLTAELATNSLNGCLNKVAAPYRCASTTQYADFARRLTKLKLADDDVYARVLDEMRDYQGGRWAGKVADGSHVFYDPAKFEVLDHGYFSPAMSAGRHYGNVTGLGVANWPGTDEVGPDRWFTWAQLKTKDAAGRVFYAVAGHMPVGTSARVTAVRYEEAQKLVAAIDALAGSTPVVLGADMNSDAVRTPSAAHGPFMRDGWFDAGAVSAKRLRTGMRVSTANSESTDGKDSGYQTRPFWLPYPTSRIDYILLKNSPHTYSYANVLRLTASGAFRKDLQGTDHNMQLAVVGIAGPAS